MLERGEIQLKRNGEPRLDGWKRYLQDDAPGQKELPERTDEDPDPTPVSPLPEPAYKGQLFTKKEMLEGLLQASDWMAWCCGFAVRRPDGSVVETTFNFHLDHIDPKSAGGEDGILNRAPLCQRCNGRKGKQTITLRQLRADLVNEGVLLVDSEADLPDLAAMRQTAGDLRARRMSERGLL